MRTIGTHSSSRAGGRSVVVPAPAPPSDPNAPNRFAVDLFDPGESNIAPGSAEAIEALGGGPGSASPAPSGSAAAATATPAPTGSPAASGGTSAGTTVDRPPARDELWVPIVLIAIVVLLAEWIVYQRDAVTRLWRGFRGRLGRGEATPATGGQGRGT